MVLRTPDDFLDENSKCQAMLRSTGQSNIWIYFNCYHKIQRNYNRKFDFIHQQFHSRMVKRIFLEEQFIYDIKIGFYFDHHLYIRHKSFVYENFRDLYFGSQIANTFLFSYKACFFGDFLLRWTSWSLRFIWTFSK